ncbi:hypothetical protein HanIR_Chr12g0563651 [Helianthus annuus]|nr:hypothetical protein HanIR_Chr12g0563651 [Helianthus annuus]
MPGIVDQVAKLGSMAFMCTMMANLTPCLATMDSKELLTNITAMGVLVITLVVNVCFQIQTGAIVSEGKHEEVDLIEAIRKVYPLPQYVNVNIPYSTIAVTYTTLLLVLLIIHVCSSFAILNSKKIIERKYEQGHKTASKELQRSSTGKFLTVEELQQHVSKYWIMAGSGNPQFVIACSVTTTASGGNMCFHHLFIHSYHVPNYFHRVKIWLHYRFRL